MNPTTRDFPTTTWIRLRDVMARRPLYLFGDGQVAIKAVRSLDSRPAGIVDNFPGYWGKEGIAGLEVLSPSSVFATEHSEASRPCFLITSTAIQAISEQLEQAGFRGGHDFWISPVLGDQEVIRRMEGSRFEFLISSGSASPQVGLSGGGIYQIRTTEAYPDVKCVYRGETHGMVAFDGGFLVTTADQGLTRLSNEYETVATQDAPLTGRLHGIAVDEARELIFVVQTDADKIQAFDYALRFQFELPVCPCYQFHRPGIHHSNDVTVVDDMLVVSMFSTTGTYRAQVYNGALASVRWAGEKSNVTFIKTELTMPHNVSNFGGTLVVLDSFHGHVLGENFRLVAQLPGFTRGLCEQSGYWLIGQSKNRNFSLLERKTPGTSVDSGVVVLNVDIGVFQTIPLPRSINEIHSIIGLSTATLD